jgi:hypothetical protein
MKTIYKEILFSTLVFISAAILTFLIHESGHAFFVKHCSLQGQLYQNHVECNWQTATKEQIIWICFGGSIFSLIQLLICFPLALKLKSTNRLIQLSACWLAFWATIQFLGYFVIGTTPSYNDIASATA